MEAYKPINTISISAEAWRHMCVMDSCKFIEVIAETLHAYTVYTSIWELHGDTHHSVYIMCERYIIDKHNFVDKMYLKITEKGEGYGNI